MRVKGEIVRIGWLSRARNDAMKRFQILSLAPSEVAPASISDLCPTASHGAAIIDFKMTRESHVRLRLHNLANCRTWRILLDGKLQGQVCGLASGNQAADGAGQVPMRCGLRIK